MVNDRSEYEMIDCNMWYLPR